MKMIKGLVVPGAYFGCRQEVVSAGLLRIFVVEAASNSFVATWTYWQVQVCGSVRQNLKHSDDIYINKNKEWNGVCCCWVTSSHYSCVWRVLLLLSG